jgi:hypothetical protein
MSRYTHFTKLKHLIFLNGGSRSVAVLLTHVAPIATLVNCTYLSWVLKA